MNISGYRRLFKYCRAFAELSVVQQRMILTLADLNNARVLAGGKKSASELVSCYQEALAEIEKQLSFKSGATYQSQRIDSLGDVLELRGRFAWNSDVSPFIRAVAFNRYLAVSGICPIVHFAFNSWFDISETHTPMDQLRSLCQLVELSTHYLYRAVEIEAPPRGSIIGRGAYSIVYADDEETVTKVPANLASFLHAMRAEFNAARIASETLLAPFLPRDYVFEPEGQTLRRQFIRGISGHALLKQSDGAADLPGLDQLRLIYDEATALYKGKGLNLDIHPGNFIWDADALSWFLVDLGPMPQIGANYYPRHGFEPYFEKVWRDRLSLMSNSPIRSIDLDPNTLAVARQLSGAK